MRAGIPRALLYYWYGPAWKIFLAEAGFLPVVSPPTNKEIMNMGLKAAVDEICLPVKVFIGHCLSLAGECEAVLVPRLTGVAPREYICPKFMGLPDLVRRLLPRTAVLTWESRDNFLPPRSYAARVCAPAGFRKPAGRIRIKEALIKAKEIHTAYTSLLQQGYLPPEAEVILAGGRPDQTRGAAGPCLGIVGHPYCIYDSFVNLGLLRLVREEGYRVVTPEMASGEQLNRELAKLPKPVYWTMEKKILGAARLFRRAGVRGLIHVTAFACGPESLIGELVKRENRGARAHETIPFLQLCLDEHSGEAGLRTRLEAFLDLARTRAGKERAGCI